MKLPDGLIAIIRQMSEARDIDGLEYLIRFVNRERDKLLGLNATANPHPNTHAEGEE